METDMDQQVTQPLPEYRKPVIVTEFDLEVYAGSVGPIIYYTFE